MIRSLIKRARDAVVRLRVETEIELRIKAEEYVQGLLRDPSDSRNTKSEKFRARMREQMNRLLLREISGIRGVDSVGEAVGRLVDKMNGQWLRPSVCKTCGQVVRDPEKPWTGPRRRATIHPPKEEVDAIRAAMATNDAIPPYARVAPGREGYFAEVATQAEHIHDDDPRPDESEFAYDPDPDEPFDD